MLAAPGAVLTCPDRPGQDAEIIEVTPLGQLTRVTLQLSGGMGRSLVPAPGSVPAVGETLTYTALRDDFQPVPRFPDTEQTPWTHGGPPPEYEPAVDEDAAEDMS